LPHKLLGAFKDECDERPDIVGGDRLIRFIGSDWIDELTPEKPDFNRTGKLRNGEFDPKGALVISKLFSQRRLASASLLCASLH